MIALLASRRELGERWAMQNLKVEYMSHRGGRHWLLDGSLEHFTIVTQEEQLRGMELTDWRVCDPGVSPIMEQIASTRVRC